MGVNAGHSALLALSCNARLEYYGVDLNEHSYTPQCVEFLQREFPGRVKFFAGDSRQVLPRLVARRNEYAFDLIHVDGGHTSEVAFSDLSNAIALAKGLAGRHLLVDDVHASWIFDIVCEFVSRGDLTAETMFGDWEDCRPQPPRAHRLSPVRGEDPGLATFWHGPLNPFAYGCLASFARMNAPVVVYSYDLSLDVPAGVRS